MAKTDQVLRAKGVRPSKIRVRVYDMIAKPGEHPSVDTIHAVLKKDIETLSKTTIYNTVQLFVEKGLASELPVKGRHRYDAADVPHAHRVCDRCGLLEDVDFAPSRPPSSLKASFVVRDVVVLYQGRCRDCDTLRA